MAYVVYLLGMGFLLWLGMALDIRSGFINMASLLNFWDVPTLLFLLLFCLMALLGTRSLRAFGDALLFTLGRKELTRSQCGEALLAVRLVMAVSGLAGGALTVITLVNSLRQLSDLAAVGMNFVLSLLSLWYPLVVCLALLPPAAALRRAALGKEAPSPAAVRHKRH